MVLADLTLTNNYWEDFTITPADIEFLYNHLLEKELPLTSLEVLGALVNARVEREIQALTTKRLAGGAVYLPSEKYKVGQKLVFPALKWKRGAVSAVRAGVNPDMTAFEVIKVDFEDGESREFATGLCEHALNQAALETPRHASLDVDKVLAEYGEDLQATLEDELDTNPDFVRIAGKWFVRALLVDINQGHLNLAEAVLDMSGGGPLPTPDLIEQIGLSGQANAKLVEFSLDLALQDDKRFDEVGPAGKVLWFLNRLEPEDVLRINPFLRYNELPYERARLTEAMLNLERQLDDELTPFTGKPPRLDQVSFALIFPHWRAGTLPLSPRLRQFFPTAYEAPRIRFTLVDGETGQKFPAWVVRPFGYIYGLKDWYQAKGVTPGALIIVRRSPNPGEVIVEVESRRPTREWLRTVLVGSDNGVVFAMLKQNIATSFDERMAVFVPDAASLEQVWKNHSTGSQASEAAFERTMISVVRELAKLNPQSHVHASELYAAINIIRRCPPGPILAMLASRPWFSHVGDLHFRFDESAAAERSK